MSQGRIALRFWAIVLTIVMISGALAAPAEAQLADKVADRLWESAKILDEATRAPDGGIPTDLLKRAECVAVIPSLTKAALGFGGQYGRGAVSCRRNGVWGAPSMISIGGGSFGLQIGGQSMDLMMLFMTSGSIKSLLRDKVTLGADIAVAAGPKGRSVSAETTPTISAEILTYSRTRGLFAGVALKGASLRQDSEANTSLYKRAIEPGELLLEGGVPVPEPAKKFVDALARVSK